MLMDSHILTFGQVKSKGKVIPLQAQWPLGFLVGLGSRISRHSAHEGGKVVTLTHRPSLPAGKSWYSFLEAESTPRHVELSDAPEKIPSYRGSIPGPFDQQRSALTTTPPQAWCDCNDSYFYGHPRKGNHDIATLRHSIPTYIFHSCLQTFFSRQVQVCYFFVILKCSLSHISYKMCVIVILSYSRWSILWK